MSRNWIMVNNDSDSQANRRGILSESGDSDMKMPWAKRGDLPRTPTEWAVAIVLPAGMGLLLVLAKLWISGRWV